jgi:RNA polymerase sigma-70 factor (ECF subfamily)
MDTAEQQSARGAGRASKRPGAGKPPSFERLYERSRDVVYAYVRSILADADRQAAEDVTALVFERAFRRRRQLEQPGANAQAWLFAVARNAALDEVRRRRRRRSAPLESASGATQANRGAGEHESDDAERRLLVRDAVRRLTRSERELVALKFWAGLTNAEIAHVLEISESNVGTRLSRVVQRLREVL